MSFRRCECRELTLVRKQSRDRCHLLESSNRAIRPLRIAARLFEADPSSSNIVPCSRKSGRAAGFRGLRGRQRVPPHCDCTPWSTRMPSRDDRLDSAYPRMRATFVACRSLRVRHGHWLLAGALGWTVATASPASMFTLYARPPAALPAYLRAGFTAYKPRSKPSRKRA